MNLHFVNKYLTADSPQLINLSPIVLNHPLGHQPRPFRIQDLDNPAPNRFLHDSNNVITWINLVQLGHVESSIGDYVYHYTKSDIHIRALIFFNIEDVLLSQILEKSVLDGSLQFLYINSSALTATGAENLISLCYGHNDWFTIKVRNRMLRERFSATPNATLLLFRSAQDPASVKKRMRDLLPDSVFRRKIHGTDTHEQTMLLIEALGNPNSRDFINRRPLSDTFDLFSRIPQNAFNDARICVDGSAVLELYGLRSARDVDLLVMDSLVHNPNFGDTDLRNYRYSSSPLRARQIISDPQLHLIIRGVKFTNLVVRMMSLALEPKSDLHPVLSRKASSDFRLIASYFSDNQKFRLTWRMMIGSSFTRARLTYAFLVQRIVPGLPLGLSRLLPKIRRRLSER